MSSVDESVRVLYEDEHYVAVYKPPGLLVHRTSLDAGTSDAALQVTRDLVGGRVYPVHRLDKPTSGLLLFGKSNDAAGALGQLIAARSVHKEYLALVRGWTPLEATIDYPLGPTRDHRRLRRSPPVTESGLPPATDPPGPTRQDAVTRYRTERRFEIDQATGRYASTRSSLVRLTPSTGRTHQLRRHMKHVFHPIIGDRKYGDDAHNRFYEARFDCDVLLLASTGLQFEHPFSGDAVTIESDPGPLFSALLTGLQPWERPLTGA